MRRGRKTTRPSIRALSGAMIMLCGVILVAGATAARSDLRNVTVVTEGLIATAIAYEIGDKCDSLDARVLAGIDFLWSLRNHARGLGYSDSEIDSFVNDRAEQDRLEAIARARLRDMGAVRGEWASYCEVGEAEIARASRIGKLLR